MRYWTQYKAPAGNWVDSLGSEEKESCRNFAKYLNKEQGKEVRVVHRIDSVVWEPTVTKEKP